ncbi:hypothetical protein F0562_005849 [Nyssa sinensis]|uniref:Uncharacterized protein n=1 Tax=Nyssa sinensis TaxID=561372 RepID=A0A5J5AKG7_9ASTE|nr:hypothetical protein F0562_005849 [Nyssa sinensis]
MSLPALEALALASSGWRFWLSSGGLALPSLEIDNYVDQFRLEWSAMFEPDLEGSSIFEPDLEGSSLKVPDLDGSNPEVPALEGSSLEGPDLDGANPEVPGLEGSAIFKLYSSMNLE